MSDCPYYARAELLGDKLALNLPDFKLHKIVIQPDEWEVFMNLTFKISNYQYIQLQQYKIPITMISLCKKI